MDQFLRIDLDKCTHCGLCVSDCLVKAIKFDRKDKIPVASADGEKICIDCQHCLAICPTGALSIKNVSAANCPPLENLPDSNSMLALIRQRRSIRKFKKESIPLETLEKLIDSLNWSPTGRNDHSLVFFVADSEEIAKLKKVTDFWMKFLIRSGLMRLFLPAYRRYFSDIMRGADIIYRGAPHLIVACVPKKSPCKNTDPVIALTQFDLYAQTLNVGCCWCGFAEYAFRFIPKLRRMIGVPKGYKVGGVLLFGTPDVHYCRATKPEKYQVFQKSSEN